MQVIADTSALVALASSRDTNHDQAVSFRRTLSAGDALIVTDFVFDETITRLRMADGHRAAVAAGHAMRGSGLVRATRVSEQDFEDAWRRFQQYSDQRLSFTDCTIAAVAERLGVQRIFTFDDDFARLGFEQVPTS